VGDDDHGAGWRTVFDTPRSFDLLKLQNDVTAALGELEVPAGKITQIRLFIDPAGTNAITLTDGRVCPLGLQVDNNTGVKIIHPFKIAAGQTTEVVIDFDLKESVSQDAPCTFTLAPVIKVKSVKGP
jgi:hypothetical protein